MPIGEKTGKRVTYHDLPKRIRVRYNTTPQRQAILKCVIAVACSGVVDLGVSEGALALDHAMSVCAVLAPAAYPQATPTAASVLLSPSSLNVSGNIQASNGSLASPYDQDVAYNYRFMAQRQRQIIPTLKTALERAEARTRIKVFEDEARAHSAMAEKNLSEPITITQSGNSGFTVTPFQVRTSTVTITGSNGSQHDVIATAIPPCNSLFQRILNWLQNDEVVYQAIPTFFALFLGIMISALRSLGSSQDKPIEAIRSADSKAERSITKWRTSHVAELTFYDLLPAPAIVPSYVTRKISTDHGANWRLVDPNHTLPTNVTNLAIESPGATQNTSVEFALEQYHRRRKMAPPASADSSVEQVTAEVPLAETRRIAADASQVTCVGICPACHPDEVAFGNLSGPLCSRHIGWVEMIDGWHWRGYSA